MREWLTRFFDSLRRGRLDRELGEELRLHRQLARQDAMRDGLGETDADHAARRRLGSELRIIEASRDRWSLPWLDHLQQDVRYALRGLRKSPGFTVTAVVTLGLGLGANAAMFGIVDRLMFRPFPYLHAPSEVHRVYLRYRFREQEFTETGMEYTRYLDLRRWTTSFSQATPFFHTTLAVGEGEQSRERVTAAVGASYFAFFDAKPALGRFFAASEDTTPRGASVVVLSYALWQSEYGGRQDVLGKPIRVDDMLCTIIGVAPEGFTGAAEQEPPALFLPITTYAGNRPGEDGQTYFTKYWWGWMEMMVRVKPGVTVDAASADLTNAFVRSWSAAREASPGDTPVELARPRGIVGSLKTSAGPDPSLEARTVVWVLGVAAIVLLIACANVANLLLARALRRRRETALRLALGVRRGRLVAQSMTESLVLAVAGCAVGLLVAQFGVALLRRYFLRDAAPIAVGTDLRTLAVVAVAALLAALLTGLAPAFLAGREELSSALKTGAREGTYHRSRARTTLLILQGALSVVLLVGAGLFVRSLDNVRSMRLGFEPGQVLMVRRSLRGAQLSDSQRVQLGRRLVDVAQAVPGVEHVTYVSSIPFWSTSSTRLFVAGIDSVARLGRFTYQIASTDYFATMGTRILRGRGFTDADRGDAPRIAVVSEGMAAAIWPGKDAIGQCMRVGADTMPCTTVVGVSEDAVQNSMTDAKRYRYYLPLAQYRPTSGSFLLARVSGDPAASVQALHRALQAEMPGQGYVTVRPLRELIESQQLSWRLGATLFAAFGVLALIVAAVGLYGVIGYNVAQRMHDLGVRVALGAQRTDVLGLVVGQGVRYALAGLTLGAALALAAARFVQPLLFEQSARDPFVYGGVAMVLLLVALVASLIPALRATHADPNTVLRSE